MWGNILDGKLFYHVSTDEVYGALGVTGLFTEHTPYRPNSPYSASKASSNYFVRAYGKHTISHMLLLIVPITTDLSVPGKVNPFIHQ